MITQIVPPTNLPPGLRTPYGVPEKPIRSGYGGIVIGGLLSPLHCHTQFFQPRRLARLSPKRSFAKALPLDKMGGGILDPEMIEDSLSIVKEAMEDKSRINLIIDNRLRGNVPLVPQIIANKLHKEKKQILLRIS